MTWPAIPEGWSLPLQAFVPALLLSWIFCAVVLRVAPRLGFIDHPAERKAHTRPTPKGGGAGIFLALVLTAFGLGLGPRASLLLACGGVLVVLGAIDDRRPLSWQLRIGVHAIVAGATVLTGPADVPWAARLVGIVWVVGLINALNMLDNMDALSSGVAWIAAGFLVLAQPLTPGQPAVLLVALMGALLGFLWYNWPPARLFMGDAGSTLLGYLLGTASLDLAFAEGRASWSWLGPLCILAVPCYDMASVVLLRLSQGRSPFHADKQHLSHRLVGLGLSSPVAVRVLWLMALASGASGLLLYRVEETSTALLIGGQLAAWWIVVAVIEWFAHSPQRWGSVS